MSLGTILLIILVLILLGAFIPWGSGPVLPPGTPQPPGAGSAPYYPYGYGYGWSPIGIVGFIVIILVVLLLLGRL